MEYTILILLLPSSLSSPWDLEVNGCRTALPALSELQYWAWSQCFLSHRRNVLQRSPPC